MRNRIIYTIVFALASAPLLADGPLYSVKTLASFTFTDPSIGVPLTASPSSFSGVNSVGDAVGSISVSGAYPGSAGFVYRNGKPSEIGSGSRQNGSADAINDRGDIAYSNGSYGQFSYSYAYVLSAAGTFTRIGLRTGQTYYGGTTIYDYAYGLNNVGSAVGVSFTGYSFTGGTTQSVYHAFLYANGTNTDLGTLGGTSSYAYGVNDVNTVVGSSITATGATHAFLYQGAALMDLGTLGGTTSTARAINKDGQIVGGATNASGNEHAFLYQNGAMQDLGVLPGETTSRATGINGLGQIVGFSGSRAFVYSSGTMYDLSALVGGTGATGYATSISESGRISGSLNGYAAIFTPVPEPSTLAALALGGLVVLRRKRRSAA